MNVCKKKENEKVNTIKARALSGIRILEYAHFVSGPFCTKLMAGMGAEVIKIEEPDTGDEARAWGPFPGDIRHQEKSGLFLSLNTNKMGITLDPKHQKGYDIFRQLVKQADILVENNPPSKMEEFNLTYDTLRRINPKLILTSLTPFGLTGPYRDYKAGDLVSFHMGGMGCVTPDWVENPDQEPPLKAGGRQADYLAGLAAAVITMGAVHGCLAERRGQHIDLSEQDAVASVMARYLAVKSYEEGTTGRDGIPFMERPLPCKNGYVEFHCVEDYHWKALLKVMGNPDWGQEDLFQDYASRCHNWSILEPLLSKWTENRTKDEIYRAMQSEGVAFSPVNSTGDLLESEQLKARGFFVDIDHPIAGGFRYPGAPFRFSETPWSTEKPAPLLGQHNEEIFQKRLGMSKHEMDRLKREGII